MNQMKGLWQTVAGVAAIAGVLSVGGCKNEGSETASNSSSSAAPAGGEIALGLYTSMTGSGATYGESTRDGIKMAIDEANANGGILGKKLRLQLEDNAGKPDQAVTVVQKLISSDKVLVVLGDFMSSNTLAAAPICQAAKVPMMSPTATNAEVTKKGDYIFRACFIDSFQGTVGARFAKDKLKAKSAAILIDTKSDHSRGVAKFFETEFKKSGTIVSTEYYSAGDGDFRAQLTNIKSKNPDVLYIPGYYTEVGAIALQTRAMGMKQPMLGTDAWDSPMLAKIGKKAIEGSYFSTHYSAETKDPLSQKFVTDYKKAFNGQEPDALSAVAYDAAKIVIAAIEKSGATQSNEADRKKIRDAIAATKDFPGVTGKITLNAQRDAVKPAVLVQVKDGKFSYFSTVSP